MCVQQKCIVCNVSCGTSKVMKSCHCVPQSLLHFVTQRASMLTVHGKSGLPTLASIWLIKTICAQTGPSSPVHLKTSRDNDKPSIHGDSFGIHVGTLLPPSFKVSLGALFGMCCRLVTPRCHRLRDTNAYWRLCFSFVASVVIHRAGSALA